MSDDDRSFLTFTSCVQQFRYIVLMLQFLFRFCLDFKHILNRFRMFGCQCLIMAAKWQIAFGLYERKYVTQGTICRYHSQVPFVRFYH